METCVQTACAWPPRWLPSQVGLIQNHGWQQVYISVVFLDSFQEGPMNSMFLNLPLSSSKGSMLCIKRSKLRLPYSAR